MSPSLSELPFQIQVNPALLWIVLTLFIVFFIAVSLVLMFHWREYTFNKKTMKRAISIYVVVSSSLAGISVVSLILFTLSAL